MKRTLIMGLVVLLASILLAAPAGAAPPGLLNTGDPFVCDGQDTVIFGGNGRSGWFGDTLYVATAFTGTGTFYPAGGGDPVVQTFGKTWGKGPAGTPVECISHFEDSDETGSWVVDFTAFAVKVPGH